MAPARAWPRLPLVEVLIAARAVAGHAGSGVDLPGGAASSVPRAIRPSAIAGLGGVAAAVEPELNRSGSKVGWAIFRDDTHPTQGWSNRGQWMAPGLLGTGEPNFDSRMAVDSVTGLLRIYSDNPSGPPATRPFGDDVLIPLSARLAPGAFLRGTSPRVEWIFAARRVITRFDQAQNPVPTTSDELEVAVFVRPIDRAIPVPRRNRAQTADWARLGRAVSLSDVLRGAETSAQGGTPAITSGEARVPVAVRPSTGLPSGNGQGLYAVPFTVPLKDYEFDDTNQGVTADDRDRLQIDLPASSALLVMLSQVGQRFVDGRGNVYRVRGVSSADPTIVLVEPRVSSAIRRSRELGELVASPTIRPPSRSSGSSHEKAARRAHAVLAFTLLELLVAVGASVPTLPGPASSRPRATRSPRGVAAYFNSYAAMIQPHTRRTSRR